MKNLHARTPNLKQAISFTLLFILLAVGHCFAAAWEGTDDFSSGISTNNWAFNHNNSGEVRVLGTNGHASFIVPDILAADTSHALLSSGISTNNWAFNHNNSGEVRVLGTNGHASFIVPDILAADTSEALIWHGNPTAAEDWNVEGTGHVSAPSARTQL